MRSTYLVSDSRILITRVAFALYWTLQVMNSLLWQSHTYWNLHEFSQEIIITIHKCKALKLFSPPFSNWHVGVLTGMTQGKGRWLLRAPENLSPGRWRWPVAVGPSWLGSVWCHWLGFIHCIYKGFTIGGFTNECLIKQSLCRLDRKPKEPVPMTCRCGA